MATLKEFEEALRERDRATRTVKPARRLTGQKMTPDLARAILDLHATTGMTQQEIAFKVGVNQGRVNEVIKRGKWLTDDPQAPEAVARDKAKARMRGDPKPKKAAPKERKAPPRRTNQGQLALGDL